MIQWRWLEVLLGFHFDRIGGRLLHSLQSASTLRVGVDLNSRVISLSRSDETQESRTDSGKPRLPHLTQRERRVGLFIYPTI